MQVHPDDAYGLEHEGEAVCWYVISAEPGAKIVYGRHKAQSRQEFEVVAAGVGQTFLVEGAS